MSQTWKIIIVAVLIVSVIAVFTIKRNKSEPATEAATDIAADVSRAKHPYVSARHPRWSFCRCRPEVHDNF